MAGKTVARLFVDAPLSDGAVISATRDQAHYLQNVLRLGAGDSVLVFNGSDGEWTAELEQKSKKALLLGCRERTQPQKSPSPITYAFAPLKHARLDFIAQKAAEMGVAAVQPVITDRTIARKFNGAKFEANLVEGAEQCGVLWVPKLRESLSFDRFVASQPDNHLLVFCDETAAAESPLEALKNAEANTTQSRAITVLLGPEGGFTPAEQKALRAHPATVPISLGPRIMRADTAAIAALTLVQALLGDWPRE